MRAVEDVDAEVGSDPEPASVVEADELHVGGDDLRGVKDGEYTASVSFDTETAGRARMHTCLDQYNENKGASGNGGLNWIQKGGGYYSECNKRLKG